MGDSVILRATRPGDVPALCAISNRAHLHDRIPQVLEAEEMVEELAEIDEARDVRVAEIDGVVVGHVRVHHFPSSERLERAFVMGDVDPPFRGRGVGRAMLSWARERGGEQLRASGNALPKMLLVEAYEQVEDAHALFQQMGFTPIRWFEELLRPLDPLPDVRVDDRYSIEDWPTGRDDELRSVRNEAFADHWGSTPWSAERYAEVMAKFGTRTDLSVVAVEKASGAIVGVCINDHYPQDAELTGRVDGWIGVLGTRAAHRGHGLASGMIRASLARFVAAGFTHASIGVDGASPTGANLLYRSLGFAPEQRHTTYEIPLDGQGASARVSGRAE